MLTFYNRRPLIFTIIDSIRELFDRRSERNLRLDDALHRLHNFDIYR